MAWYADNEHWDAVYEGDDLMYGQSFTSNFMPKTEQI